MQEVTCFQCRNVVQIAPGDDHCSACGEDLRGLLDEQVVSDFFYDRANELADAGLLDEALEEVELGLTYHELSELRLLAAILSEETGKYDVMRRHAAAIPITDSLRSEAEWLLRAHQEKQRALREGAKQVRYGGPTEAQSATLAEILGQQPPQPPVRDGMQLWTRVAAVLIVVILSLTWLAARRLSGEGVQPPAAPPVIESRSTEVTAGVSAASVETSVVSPRAENEPGKAPVMALPTVTPVQNTEMPQSEAADAIPTAVTEDAIADSNPRSVVVLTAAGFDLAQFFREIGSAELAALPLDARLQEDKLVVSGIVYLDRQRREIEELLATIPGVADVSTADLVIRPKPTYTVQEGDTIWSIVFDIYGDYERVEEFYLYNSDLANSPDSLPVGAELRVPPNE